MADQFALAHPDCIDPAFDDLLPEECLFYENAMTELEMEAA
jgi:hypothetical protein